MVEAVVVGAVHLGVVGWGQYGHLVAVDGVEAEEALHLHSHLKEYFFFLISLFILKLHQTNWFSL